VQSHQGTQRIKGRFLAFFDIQVSTNRFSKDIEFFCFLNVYFHLGFAASGFDLSTPLTEANAQCMVGAGYSLLPSCRLINFGEIIVIGNSNEQ
jgi:hypothetical protein